MSTKSIYVIGLIIAFVAFMLNLTAFASDHWWVSIKTQEFNRVGLWQICFNQYRHRYDFFGKIYNGCFWVLSPETRMLFSWISTQWLRVVQAFSSLSLLTMLFGLVSVFNIVINRNMSQKLTNRVSLFAALSIFVSAIFMLIVVIMFGLKGKNRDWMPNWQQGWFGWSFNVAILTCILETILGFVLLYESADIKLFNTYYKERMRFQKNKKRYLIPSVHETICFQLI